MTDFKGYLLPSTYYALKIFRNYILLPVFCIVNRYNNIGKYIATFSKAQPIMFT